MTSKLKLRSHGVHSIRSRIADLVDFRANITMDDVDDALILAFSDAIASRPTIVDFDNTMISDPISSDTIYHQLKDPNFIYNDNPMSTITLEYKHFMGLFTFDLVIDKGVVTVGTVYSDCLDLHYVETIQHQLHATLPISIFNLRNSSLFNRDNDDVLYMLGRDLLRLRV